MGDVGELDPKTFVIVEMGLCEPGVLNSLLRIFADSNLNISNIESRFKSFSRSGPCFHLDVEACSKSDERLHRCLKEVKATDGVHRVSIMEDREVPWFPLNIRDLDITVDTLDGGTALINEDHPGFNDTRYKKRRAEVVELAHSHRHGNPLPLMKYTDDETKTWQAVYEKCQACHKQWACREYLDMLPQMERFCGYAPNNIPQLRDISDFLQQRTGFTLRPIAGLLSARDFLNALAFRVFYSTQYLRHHGNPFYTPEPDIVHELLGHVPLFANPSFADFSHEIGLASLSASDEDVNRLASVYWFSVEFGLLRQDGDLKAYGAGLLSSFGEMEWSCAKEPSAECRKAGSIGHLMRPELLPFSAKNAAATAYPITTYQPVYFVADSLGDAKASIDRFCDSLQRPFFPQYDALTQTIKVTKAIRRAERVSTVKLQAEKQEQFFKQETQSAASQPAAQ